MSGQQLLLQSGRTFFSRKINVAKNRDGQWSGGRWDDLGCPEMSSSLASAVSEEQSHSHGEPQHPEMWGGKKQNKTNNGEGRKTALKTTKQFVIKGREPLVKQLSKLGLSLNLGIKSGRIRLRLPGGSLWVAKDKVLTRVPDK